MGLSRAELLMWLSVARCHRKEAAALAGVSEATLYRDIKRHRIQLPDNRRKLTPVQVQEIRQCGGSYRVTAERYNVSVNCVRKIRSGEIWNRG